MPRFSRRDSAALKEARAHLLRDEGHRQSPLDEVLKELSGQFGARVYTYGVAIEEGRFAVDRWAAFGNRHPVPNERQYWDQVLGTVRHKLGLYSPARPEPDQRNIALIVPSFRDGLESDQARPPARRMFEDELAATLRRATLYNRTDDAAQLRSLVCDGPNLLAWIGAFRDEPFGATERRFLGALVPALQHRLRFEALLENSDLHAAVTAAALEELPTAAAVVSKAGRLLAANSIARERFDQDRVGFAAQLRAAIQGRPSPFRLTRLEVRGAPGYWLAISTARPPDVDAAVRRATQRFGLTARQSQVLSLLARGCSTRTIAAELGCSERTVGAHVTSILERLDVATRAQAVAKIWS